MMEISAIWYRLFNAPGFGPKRLHLLYATLERLHAPLNQVFHPAYQEPLWGELKEAGFRDRELRALRELDVERLDAEHQDLLAHRVELVHLDHADYPEHLSRRMINSAPPVLFCQGRTKLLNAPGVAIVGSRNASPDGIAIAGQLAKELAFEGINVISGNAKGIDTAAHIGALKAEGTTTLVLSAGIYDFEKKKEMETARWEQDALIVSQFPPKTVWLARNAMLRNKLVCALASAVVVIESGAEIDAKGRMSGSFNAGKTALELGVRLWVVDPSAFRRPPIGNVRLVELGGKPFRPETDSQRLLQDVIIKPVPPVVSTAPAKQLSLFE